MLTDVALKNLKPKGKPYKVSDRDGMYVHVAPTGRITFRLDYRLHGRRETVLLGRYDPADLSLALAREKCIDARRMVGEGISPAQEKQRQKRRLKEAKSFGEFGERWLQKAPMADSTRAMRRSILERELRPVWQKRLLTEILYRPSENLLMLHGRKRSDECDDGRWDQTLDGEAQERIGCRGHSGQDDRCGGEPVS